MYICKDTWKEMEMHMNSVLKDLSFLLDQKDILFANKRSKKSCLVVNSFLWHCFAGKANLSWKSIWLQFIMKCMLEDQKDFFSIISTNNYQVLEQQDISFSVLL